jgi:sensor histidine kinase YesM
MPWLLKYKIDHVAFWLFTILFHAYTRIDLINTSGALAFLSEVIIRNLILALVIYVTLQRVMPLLTTGKALQAILIIVVCILIYVILKDIHDTYLVRLNSSREAEQDLLNTSFYNLSIVLFYLAFASTLHFSKEWYLQREQMRKIELEKLNTELDYLRAQINPHFLFNSINTIYFQIDKENKAARETLDKFSAMLRYQLYECSGNEIAIEKEIKYLQSYVDLQRLRLNQNFLVTFNVDDEIRNFNVPPLLFIPFIENAFKHVSHFSNRINEIHITIKRNESILIFDVRNTNEDQQTEPATEGGIGLKNISRRLELLYGSRYELRVNDQSDYFTIHLTIPIV